MNIIERYKSKEEDIKKWIDRTIEYLTAHKDALRKIKEGITEADDELTEILFEKAKDYGGIGSGYVKSEEKDKWENVKKRILSKFLQEKEFDPHRLYQEVLEEVESFERKPYALITRALHIITLLKKPDSIFTWIFTRVRQKNNQLTWVGNIIKEILKEEPSEKEKIDHLKRLWGKINEEFKKNNIPEGNGEIEGLRKKFDENLKDLIDMDFEEFYRLRASACLEDQKQKDNGNRLKAFFKSHHFLIPDAYLANYIISLKTKPFVLLAGISGTGKTKLTRIFAEAVNGRRLIDVSLEELYYIFAPAVLEGLKSEEISKLKENIFHEYQNKWNEKVRNLLKYLQDNKEVLCRIKYIIPCSKNDIDDEILHVLWYGERVKQYPGLVRKPGEGLDIKQFKDDLKQITFEFLKTSDPQVAYKNVKDKLANKFPKKSPRWTVATRVLHIITLLRNPQHIFASIFPNLAQIMDPKQGKVYKQLQALKVEEIIGKEKYEEIEKKAKNNRIGEHREEHPEGKIEFLTKFYLKLKDKLPSPPISKENQELYDSLITPTGYKLIPVQPDWNDKTGLMGYYNAIEGKYQMTEFLKFIIEAMKNPCVPYFVCLDEMNLARVEYYFNDFLSKMETMDEKRGWESEPVELRRVTKKEWNEKKDEEEPFGIPKELWGNEEEGKEEKEGEYKVASIRIPPNLFILGTVNMDETTYQFSPKVLDRANTIEFNIVNVKKYFNTILGNITSDNQELDGDEKRKIQNFLLSRVPLSCIKNFDKKSQIQDILNELNNILATRNFHFGYRTMEEITRYVYNACVEFPKKEYFGENPFDNSDELNFYAALDFQILQKILPKINGDRDRVGNVIDELLEKLLEKLKDIGNNFDKLIKNIWENKINKPSDIKNVSDELEALINKTMEYINEIDFGEPKASYIPFIRSIYKLLRMKERLDQFDTTSFYEY